MKSCDNFNLNKTVFWDVTLCHVIEVLQCLEERAATILKMGESSSVNSINSYNITQHHHSENNVLYRPVFLYSYTITKRFSFDKQVYLGILQNNRTTHFHSNSHIYTYIYRVSQEERTKLREGVPYVKLYRYNPKHLYPKLNGYGDNGK